MFKHFFLYEIDRNLNTSITKYFNFVRHLQTKQKLVFKGERLYKLKYFVISEYDLQSILKLSNKTKSSRRRRKTS